MKKFTSIIAIIVLSTSVFANGAQQPTTLSNRFSEIREMHLSSLPAPIIKKEEPDTPKKKTAFEECTGSERPDYFFNPLSQYELYALIYEIFSKLPATEQPLSIINKNAWKDLELVTGGRFLKSLTRTQTTLGSVYLASMITHPCDDLVALKNRQAIIQALVTDKALAKNLTTLLIKVKETESIMLSFWKEENKAEKTFIDQLYSTDIQRVNTSPEVQDFCTVSMHLLSLGILAASYSCGLVVGYSQYKYDAYGKMPREGNIAFCTAIGGCMIYKTYLEFMVIKNYHDLLNYIYEKTNAIATVVRVLDSTAQALNDYPELQHLESARYLLSFNKKNGSLSLKLQFLISLLQTSTFKRKVPIFS